MFVLFKKMFVGLLTSIESVSNHTKCVLVSNQKCMTQTILVNLDPFVLLTYSASKVRSKAFWKRKKEKDLIRSRTL